MGRRIITEQLQSTNNKQTDNYLDKLNKYIPAEILAAWVLISNIIKGREHISKFFVWCTFIMVLLASGFWVKMITDEENKPTAWTQIFISMGAFFVWAFALGEPFSYLDCYDPTFGPVVMIVYIVFASMINPKE